ncbi:MFS transporter [Citrobacter sp. JGM124]|uniref:MFS transporter n=1 Tax=Citrobacter sp. JGM124 TaxID=2799789 RepID=UPI001BA53B3B|nr:MFS transporter [Citrobacter sp. JGM124]MBS0849152.1 MFS transporter [Citrobacter sp. JGM124]
MPFVIYLLGLTIFSLTTAEFMVAGMMPALAVAFDVSVGQIGYLITYYALGMAIGGPLLTALLLVLGTSNKQALFCLLLIYIASGVLAAVAGRYDVMAVARIIMGISSSACFGVALTICASLVAPEKRGQAASFVLGGLMLAPVFGVPATALIEQYFGWRFSFWAIVVLAVLCAVIIAKRVPDMNESNSLSLKTELRSLYSRKLWAAYATSGLIIGAAFSAFSFFVPIFTEVTHFPTSAIPWLLVIYGVANIIGNIFVGRFADRYTIITLAMGLALLCLGLVIFAVYAQHRMISLGALVLIGLTGVALNPAMVARVMRAATPGPLVNTMHSSVITAGLALGSWAGSYTIDAGLGLRSPLWVGVVLALLGLLTLIPYLRKKQQCVAVV